MKKAIFNNHEEWLEFRKKGIGSSEAGTIMGVNPYQSPYQLWQIKKGLVPPTTENEAMLMGHILEDAVAQRFVHETKREIIKGSEEEYICYDEERPYLRVSPDREFLFADGNKGILECKTTRMSVDVDNIPPYWFCQLQYQCHILGYAKGSIAWIRDMGFEFGYKDFNHDANFCGMLVNEIEKFYFDYIEGDKEPEPTTMADIVSKYPVQCAGKFIDADTDVKEAYDKLKDIRLELKILEEKEALYSDRIKSAMGDAEGLMYEGKTLATWKAGKSSVKFDAKLFQEQNPEMAEKYMKEVSGSRRFLLK